MHHKELELQEKINLEIQEKINKYIIPTKHTEVNHPKHYASGKIECIDAIEACMSKEAFKGLLKGSILQYVWRYENKGGLTDLQKAQWYLDRLIKNVTNN